jgi:hypothetical protein
MGLEGQPGRQVQQLQQVLQAGKLYPQTLAATAAGREARVGGLAQRARAGPRGRLLPPRHGLVNRQQGTLRAEGCRWFQWCLALQ